jgi:hypothetical protein
MAAGAWTFTNTARTKILDGTLASGSSWKVALLLSTSNISVASTTFAGVTNEHAAANGYTAGGIAVTPVLSGTTSVTWSFVTNPVWTASGGSIVARFAVLYKVSSGDIMAYCLLDSAPADVTTTNGNTLTVDSDGTPGPVLTLA